MVKIIKDNTLIISGKLCEDDNILDYISDNITKIEFDECDSSNINSMNFKLAPDSSVKEIISNASSVFDNVSSFDYVLCDCRSIVNIYMPKLDLPSLMSARYGFAGCENLKEVRFDSLKTSFYWNGMGLFKNCINLEFVWMPQVDFDLSDSIDVGCKYIHEKYKFDNYYELMFKMLRDREFKL